MRFVRTHQPCPDAIVIVPSRRLQIPAPTRRSFRQPSILGPAPEAIRDVELSQHVAVVGGAVAPFMAPPDTHPAAPRAVDSLAIISDDPVAAEIQQRRDEIGFSFSVFGGGVSDALAPVVAELTGT